MLHEQLGQLIYSILEDSFLLILQSAVIICRKYIIYWSKLNSQLVHSWFSIPNIHTVLKVKIVKIGFLCTHGLHLE